MAFAPGQSSFVKDSSGLAARIINPLSGSEWDDLVAGHPEATVFHTSAWARVLTRTYGHSPVYLQYTGSGESVALLPLMEVSSRVTGRRGVCLPFSDFCGPLLSANSAAAALTDEICRAAAERNWKHIELRSGAFEPAGERVGTFFAHTLDLSGGEVAIFARFQPSVQRAIRKAEKSGVVVEISQTAGAMEEFYRLHRQTRRSHGAPPQPFAFFRHIQEEIIAPGLGFTALARSGAGCIAASIFFHRAGAGLYKFGASEKQHQNVRPNHLTMWAGIRHLLNCGGRTLHFGRTSPDDEGLRRYKRSWGATEQMLSYLRFDPPRQRWISVPPSKPAGFRESVFSRLPLAVNALAGQLIYPHLD